LKYCTLPDYFGTSTSVSSKNSETDRTHRETDSKQKSGQKMKNKMDKQQTCLSVKLKWVRFQALSSFNPG